MPKKILIRLKENNGSTDIPIRNVKVDSHVDPLPCVVGMIEEKIGGDRAPEGPMEGGETNKDVNTDRSQDVSRDVNDDLQVTH